MQEFEHLEDSTNVLKANHHADASARQNAEQQLSQAAELNFVSDSLLSGMTPPLYTTEIES